MSSLHKQIYAITEFLRPFSAFINCHMVNYLTDNHWEHFISSEVREEIDNFEEAIECVFWNGKESSKFKNLQNFIKSCRNLYLENSENITSSIEDVILNISEGNLLKSKNFEIYIFYK